MKLGIDLMGGDYCPLEAVRGVKCFVEKSSANGDSFEIVMLGEEKSVLPLLKEYQLDNDPRLRFVPCATSVCFEDSAVRVFKEKENSSLCKGFSLLQAGEIDAFVSAGHTGAMLVGAHTIIKVCENVLRPCIGAILPIHPSKKVKIPSLLLDVGSNVECKPEQLNQMAILGAVYMETRFPIKDKIKVALLNVGEEPNKGNLNYTDAYKLLSQNDRIQFVGNIEGRDILSTTADVIVCDGFLGNIILKLLESLYEMLDLQVGGSTYLNQFNFQEYGGIPVLGVRKPVVVGHGISKGQAFEKMIALGFELIEKKLCAVMERELSK